MKNTHHRSHRNPIVKFFSNFFAKLKQTPEGHAIKFYMKRKHSRDRGYLYSMK